MNEKVKTARLSVFSNTLLIILKVGAGIITGSVSIISEAIHSGMDLLAAIIAYFSVRVSSNPPDRDHPYGHGKYENISGVIEALLIFAASGWIIFEAVKKIVKTEPVESIGVGALVMFISAAVNFVVSRKLYKVAKKEDSVALEADALHLKADVYTSLGVGTGLFLIWLTGYTILDPVAAILIALFILYESYHLLKKAFFPLLDTALSDHEIMSIEQCLYERKNIKFHDLRTRKSGNIRYVDFHLEVDDKLSVKESHDLCDEIEHCIKREIKNAEVFIHVEPVEKN